MGNSRFPHTLQVLRAKRLDGELCFDENGNPIYEPVLLSVVQTFDGEPVKGRSGHLIVKKQPFINFGYRTSNSNTSVTGDVIKSDYKIATPMFTTPLNAGDRIEVTDYDRTFMGEIVKKTTFNWGSNIWFNDVRN